nr:MAG TPA: Replicative helicase [Caudoviricetes sp.]
METVDIKTITEQRMKSIAKQQTEAVTEKTGTKVETVNISEILKKDRISDYKKISVIYKKEMEQTFENSYVKNKKEKEYKSSFEKFCKNFDIIKKDGLGIYMSGTEGTGKSYWTNCIYHRLKNDYAVYKTSLQELLDEIRETFGEKTTTTNFLKKRLGNADLIIFEDLGNEFLTDWVKEKLYFIFDFIDKTDKSIIINTNLNDSQIEDFFKILGSSKLLSRVRSKTKYYKFDWEDRRIGKYKEKFDKYF